MEKATFHARQVCGIAAHTRDKGVSSISIRSLAIASHCLKDEDEKAEVKSILERIHSETGWRLGKVYEELKKNCGSNQEARRNLAPVTSMPAPTSMMAAAATTVSATAPQSRGTTSNPVKSEPVSGSLNGRSSRARNREPPSMFHQQALEQERERERQRQQAQVHQQQQIAAAQQYFAATSNGGGMPLNTATSSIHTIAQSSPKMPVPVCQLGGGNNPLVAADFSLPNHPYTGFYQPPTNRTAAFPDRSFF